MQLVTGSGLDCFLASFATLVVFADEGAELSRHTSLDCALGVAVGCCLGTVFESQKLVNSGFVCSVIWKFPGSMARRKRV